MTETRVDTARLRVRIDPASLPFETTADLGPADGRMAQERAYDAVELWASIEGSGFNLFASGPAGIGRRTAIRSVLDAHRPRPDPFDDWVYVNNFQDPHRPRALKLPFGTAMPFSEAMVELVEELAVAVPAVFESDDYKTRRNAIEATSQAEQETRIGDLRERAARQDIGLVRTPVGFAFVPTRNGEIVKPEVFNKWPAVEREAVEKKVSEFQEELGELIRHDLPALERDARAQIRELTRESVTVTIDLAITETAAKFEGIEPIQRHIADVANDLVENFRLFVALAQAGDEVPLAIKLDHPMLRRYAVNVMDASPSARGLAGGRDGTPVVEESDPTHANLIGRIEHQPIEGALMTDFTMIKPGALHRANGGYLVLDARDMIMQPFAWESLKRCLKTSSIRVTSVAERVSLVSTISLEPDEIPLSVNVALIGDRLAYYLLSSLDPDFPRLFKVHADFEDDISRSPDAESMMAEAIAGLARERLALPVDRTAVAAVLEEASRLSDDAAKFSLSVEALSDLLQESQHWARVAGSERVDAGHVRHAVDQRRHRANRLNERSVEMVERGIVNIDVEGSAIGQINGLSVISLGETRFGRPSRITVRTRMGTGKIIDIEREVKLGGPLHSKGVLILSSFLATRYGAEAPVSVAASIVFEQSYGGVDGDSASSTELYALLSALADAPISQSLAVTGSVDQFGRVQAIGGVNEKIEGFFDLCSRRGLSDGQGVMIPAANVQHLNLRPDVVEAVEAGDFTIHAVDHVDTGIELLTGIEAGAPDADGKLAGGQHQRAGRRAAQGILPDDAGADAP